MVDTPILAASVPGSPQICPPSCPPTPDRIMSPSPAEHRRAGARLRRSGLLALADRDLSSRSEGELIAQVLAGPEPAAEVIRCAADLARLPFSQRRSLGIAGLVAEHGVLPERAVRLAALWELADRWYPDDRPGIVAPRDALLLLDGLRRERTEQIVAILLDARHRLIGQQVVAVGTINASRLAPRDVIGPALLADAAAIVVAHNHPSGDPTPSRADHRVTLALRRACDVMGLPLLDHIVVARGGHYSFRESEQWGTAE